MEYCHAIVTVARSLSLPDSCNPYQLAIMETNPAHPYCFWCRSKPVKEGGSVNGDRWHMQSAGTLEEIQTRVKAWVRTYPTHEVCILPLQGSFPLTTWEWSEVVSR